MLLSILIVSYNTSSLTIAAVRSVVDDLKKSSLLKKSSEIIVIDNASRDDSIAVVTAFSKHTTIPIHIIAHTQNAGFAAANNLGMTKASGKYLLLLNSDTVVQPFALERLVQSMEDNPIDDMTSGMRSQLGKLDRLGIVAATLLNPDGSAQPQGGSFPHLFSLASHMLMLDDIPFIGQFLPSTQHTGKRATQKKFAETLCQQDWVGGTAMLIRRQVIDEVGELDGHIFMYGEDVEFCMRAKQHHWDIAVHPASLVLHYGTASSTSAQALKGELSGYLYIWSKHKPIWQVPLARILIKIGVVLRVFVFGTMNLQKAQVYREVLRELKMLC